MSLEHEVTRFAPSPTGALHLGNARTALFNQLAARASGGHLVLRIEDTDAERSDDELLARMLADLRWFGLDWQEGPDVGGPNGPYRQSLRGHHYASAIDTLARSGRVYPCFCSPETLRLERRAQLAAGRPPRYGGTCASLSVEEIERRMAEGQRPALRFRVPPARVVAFEDLIHGAQSFATDDIGDFVVRRADASVAFFLGNALDDVLMGVTLVLRGDDHLANTPRQILILEALGMRVPKYGHLPLLLAPGGAPLSKREGAAGLHEFREAGYLPGALRNYLVRLGHACAAEQWLDEDSLARDFDLSGSSRSGAHFDEAQLRHWQREAVNHATVEQLLDWLGGRLDPLGGRERRRSFVEVVRGNLLFPADSDALVSAVCDAAVEPDEDAGREIVSAGAEFFSLAAVELARQDGDFRGWTRAVAAATARKGAALYMPLRAALTGRTHGPELAPLAALMGPERLRARIDAAAALAAAG